MSHHEDASVDSPQEDTAGPVRAKIMDYRTLQAVIGCIVILLVLVVYFGNWLIFTRHLDNCVYSPQWIPGSLSGFYYTHMRNLFVGAMCAVGVFLAAYRGHDKWDDRFTNVAGLAAIGIALFPTTPPFASTSPNGPNQFFTRANPCGPSTPITYHLSRHQPPFPWAHVVSLFVLFLMVFLMVLVQFTRTKASKAEQQPPVRWSLRAWWNGLFADEQRRCQNKVFVACAGGIFLSAVLAIFTAIRPSAGKTVPWLLFAEFIAFFCFGIAWLVKGVARKHARQAGDTHDEAAGGSVPATTGAGHFDSDGARDLLDQLSQHPAGRRRGKLDEIFQAASADLPLGRGYFHDVIVAAAAVMAASLPGGEKFRRDLSGHDRIPDAIALPEATPELTALALRALLAAVGSGGPWDEGWTNPDTAAKGRGTSE